MKEYPNPLINPNVRREDSSIFLFIFLCIVALIALAYVTVVDIRALLAHANQLNAQGDANELTSHLEWEMAAEGIKIFLDLGLVIVVLIIITSNLYTLLTKKDFLGLANGLELAARMFLSRVSDLKMWIIGVVLLRMIIHYFQKLVRLQTGGEMEVVYLSLLIILLFITLVLSHHDVKN